MLMVMTCKFLFLLVHGNKNEKMFKLKLSQLINKRRLHEKFKRAN